MGKANRHFIHSACSTRNRKGRLTFLRFGKWDEDGKPIRPTILDAWQTTVTIWLDFIKPYDGKGEEWLTYYKGCSKPNLFFTLSISLLMFIAKPWQKSKSR